MIREIISAFRACVITFGLCSIVYPVAVWGVGQMAFPEQAAGSLIRDREDRVIGSELIAQAFKSDRYFFSRPSAVDYKADAAGGANLGSKNPGLRKQIAERASNFKADEKSPVPVDLVTASGSGLDPHISPEAALYQAQRVAMARKLSVEQIRSLIERFTQRSGAMIGAPPRVNVLLLNLALDQFEAPSKTPPFP